MLQHQIENFNGSQKECLCFLGKNNSHIDFFNNRNEQCASIQIQSNTTISIEFLTKCSDMSGTNVLHFIELFAKQNGYTTIELEDDARIECMKTQCTYQVTHRAIMLAILHILATGTTWYNKLGYVSGYYGQEVAHNRNIIEKPFQQFIISIAKHSDGDCFLTNSKKPSLVDLCNGMYLFVDKRRTTISVRDLFSIVMARMRTKVFVCDASDPETEWVLNILTFIQDHGVLQPTIQRAKPYNIVFLRGLPDTNVVKRV